MTAERKPRVLVVKFGAIGDVVMLLPAVHALWLQGYAIDWVCGAGVAPLLALYPWVQTIVADERAILTGGLVARLGAITKLWRSLPREQYELAATLYYDPRYRLLTLPVRARRKLMLSLTGRARQLLPGRHHTDEYARILLGWPDEIRPQPLPPVFPDSLPASPLPRPTKLQVVLAPGGARNLLADDSLRRWPVERYAALARLLLARGVSVVLTGGPTDDWVRPAFAGLDVTDAIGSLSLPQTVSLMQASDAVVTHDTGPLHLAGIAGGGQAATVLVGLFGPTDPKGRLPHRPGVLMLWGGKRFACRPCYDGRSFAPCPSNGCLQTIAPELVLEHLDRLLAARTAGALPQAEVVEV